MAKRTLYWTVKAALVAAVLMAHASDAQKPATSRLKGIKQEIGAEQRRLDLAVRERGELEQQLQTAERNGATAARQLRKMRKLHAKKDKELQQLKASRTQRQTSIHSLRLELGEQIRANYKLGRQDYLKLLLNQESPAKVTRALSYHTLVVRARSTRIAELVAQLTELQIIEERLAAEQTRLRQLHQQTVAARQEFGLQRDRRKGVLAALHRRIAQSGRRLRTLHNDAAELEAVMQRLVRVQDETVALRSLATHEPRSFKALRGSLPWPTTGTVQRRRHPATNESGARLLGVHVNAPAGQAIIAVAGGRIAYADWLRGFGLLLIIDHGDGYMTLYGHILEVWKEPGEWVQAGETVGTVGDSGGQARAGLYFEIRQRGKPVDPRRWCRARRA
jgi:murein hydrolase activator